MKDRDVLVAQIAGQIVSHALFVDRTTTEVVWPTADEIEHGVSIAKIVVGLSDNTPLEKV